MEHKTKWGFLRETQAKADKEKPDTIYGLHKTGLEEYLKVIFPKVNDWDHDKHVGVINGKRYYFRPDYRSETLKLIIEFDGTLHYKNPVNIVTDINRTALYQNGGYKVVRIPFFIQLTKEVVRNLFNVSVSKVLFDPSIPSMHAEWKNTPAYMCPAGVERMAKELLRFPQQMEINLKALKEDSKKSDGEILSGYNILCEAIKNAQKKMTPLL